MTDLLLAIVHHCLAFGLAGLLFAELVLVRPGLDRQGLQRLGRIDGLYGAVAVALILVGTGRLFMGLKGSEFYIDNPVFWLKIAAFLTVGLLSLPPTLRFVRWRRAAAASGAYVVPDAEVRAMRFYIHAELTIFVFILIFAAAMARGYGL